MKKLDEYTEQFRYLYEMFTTGCDAVEYEGDWNTEELGEMESFYVNDLVSIILRLVAADGNISEKEVMYLNKSFGFDYGLKELSEVYEECSDRITDAMFDENFAMGVKLLKNINGKLACLYGDMLAIACDIISESDDEIASAEIELAQKYKSML